MKQTNRASGGTRVHLIDGAMNLSASGGNSPPAQHEGRLQPNGRSRCGGRFEATPPNGRNNPLRRPPQGCAAVPNAVAASLKGLGESRVVCRRGEGR